MKTTYTVTTLIKNGRTVEVDGFNAKSVIVKEMISGGAVLIKEEEFTKEYNFELGNNNTQIGRFKKCSVCGQDSATGSKVNKMFLCDCCLEDQGIYEPDY